MQRQERELPGGTGRTALSRRWKKADMGKADWTRKNKMLYRRDNIVLPYRGYYGQDRLPSDQWYLSICGNNPKSDRVEIGQLIKEGLLQEEQFIGVDFCEQIIASNKENWPHAHWHCGDFMQELYRIHKMYPPSVIHADFTSMPQTSIEAVKDLFRFIEIQDRPMMLIVNASVKIWVNKGMKIAHKRITEWQEMLQNIRKSDRWHTLGHDNVEFIPEFYMYGKGLSNSRSHMASCVFFYKSSKQ